MATFEDFPQSNKTLLPAPGDEARVGALRVFTDGHQMISCWQLSPEEMVEVFKNQGRIWLYVLGGKHPPVFVGGTNPFASAPLAPPTG